MTNDAPSDAQVPPDQIENRMVMNPATSLIVAELRAVKLILTEIRSNAERQEVPAPAEFEIPFQAHTRIRALQVQLFPAGAGTYALKVGTARRRTFVAAANGALTFDFKQTVERGVRVSIVDAATDAEVDTTKIASAVLTGYTE